MKVAISQPRYLPAMNYIQRIMLCDVFVLLDCVQHQPRAFEHRNRIKTPSGRKWLSIPLERNGRALIKDLRASDLWWVQKHYKTARQYYVCAEHFDSSFFHSLYDGLDSPSLVDINEKMLRRALGHLGIERKIIRSSAFDLKAEHSGRLAEITRLAGGDTYMSGPNGRNYIKKEFFDGLRVVYHDFTFPTYRQLWGGFEPWTAFIDALFNVGLDSFRSMLEGNYEINEK